MILSLVGRMFGKLKILEFYIKLENLRNRLQHKWQTYFTLSVDLKYDNYVFYESKTSKLYNYFYTEKLSKSFEIVWRFYFISLIQCVKISINLNNF